MKERFFISLLLLTLIACKQANKIDTQTKFETYPSVPCPDSSYTSHFIRPSERHLNLSSMEKGVDSFEMRVYINGYFNLENEVYVLKMVGDSLLKKHYYYVPHQLIRPDGVIATYEHDYAIMNSFGFKGGDTSFFNLFKKSGIDTFPTQSLLSSPKNLCLDGTDFTIELATKNTYRIITYGNPDCPEGSKQDLLFNQFLKSFKLLIAKENKAVINKVHGTEKTFNSE